MFRGEGFFVPTLKERSLDSRAIIANIPLMKKKIDWISQQERKLRRGKNWPKYESLVWATIRSIEKSLVFKQEYHSAKKSSEKIKLRSKSRTEIQALKLALDNLFKKVPFLLSFGFPVDHLAHRREYDLYKKREDIKGEHLKNTIYLKRKIFEDGTFDENRRRGDKGIRSLISSLALEFKEPQDLLTESQRYDLEDLLRYLERIIENGRVNYVERLQDWKKRSVKFLQFYKELLKDDKLEKKGLASRIEKLLNNNSLSRYALKSFTYKRLAEVYDYWQNQPELMKKLFVLETILFNEVGTVDGHTALERKDVAQVVINRVNSPKYNYLPADDPVYEFLSPKVQKQSASEPWLNVLFKEGEFSFTYYFISGSAKIYCPDMSKRGRHLRRKNLKIAIQKLRHPDWTFNALRYFSRASMLGRIDMSKLWSDYRPLPERPGSKADKQHLLRRYYKRGEFRYLYTFRSEDKVQYDVIEIKGEPVVVHNKASGPRFYIYRNPHYFKYFTPY